MLFRVGLTYLLFHRPVHLGMKSSMKESRSQNPKLQVDVHKIREVRDRVQVGNLRAPHPAATSSSSIDLLNAIALSLPLTAACPRWQDLLKTPMCIDFCKLVGNPLTAFSFNKEMVRQEKGLKIAGFDPGALLKKVPAKSHPHPTESYTRRA